MSAMEALRLGHEIWRHSSASVVATAAAGAAIVAGGVQLAAISQQKFAAGGAATICVSHAKYQCAIGACAVTNASTSTSSGYLCFVCVSTD